MFLDWLIMVEVGDFFLDEGICCLSEGIDVVMLNFDFFDDGVFVILKVRRNLWWFCVGY